MPKNSLIRNIVALLIIACTVYMICFLRNWRPPTEKQTGKPRHPAQDLSPFHPQNDPQERKVKESTVAHIIDGDTIELSDGDIVRLIGVDAPESRPTDEAQRISERTGQDLDTITSMGQRARMFVLSLDLVGNKVQLEFDTKERDEHGRLWAYVFYESDIDWEKYKYRWEEVDFPRSTLERNGKASWFINGALIESGYATPLPIPPNRRYTKLFERLYWDAVADRRGLWQPPTVINSESEAIEAAQVFLASEDLDWGEPTGVKRTITDWYRVEFGKHYGGRRRYVLVNPKNGVVEFPSAREGGPPGTRPSRRGSHNAHGQRDHLHL